MHKEDFKQKYDEYQLALFNGNHETALKLNSELYEETFTRYLASNGRVKDGEQSNLEKLMDEAEMMKNTQLNNQEDAQ